VKQNHVLIDAVLRVPPTIVKLVTCPTLRACTLKQQKRTIVMNIGLLAYTFTRIGDNLTNNDGDILTANLNST